MSKKLKGCLIFLLLIFITLGAVNATDVADITEPTTTVTSTDEVTTDEVITSTTNNEPTSTTVNIGSNEKISDTIYENTSLKVTGDNVEISNVQINNNNNQKVVIDNEIGVINSLNNKISKKINRNVKSSENVLEINDDNVETYTNINTEAIRIITGTTVEGNTVNLEEDSTIIINLSNSYSKYNFEIENNQNNINYTYQIITPFKTLFLYERGTAAHFSVINTHLPNTILCSWGKNNTVINSTFLSTSISSLNTKTIITQYINVTFTAEENEYDLLTTSDRANPKMTVKTYNELFDSTNTILPTTKTNLLIKEPRFTTDQHTSPMIINKPTNIFSVENTTWNGDITFITGSEGSNLTNLTINGTIYINTTNIGIYNNTISNAIIIKDSSDNNIENNTINTTTEAITLTNTINTQIKNNNIKTETEYAITLDDNSLENTITQNIIYSNANDGNDAVNGDTDANTIKANSPEIIDLYVSDSTGSDDNSGEETSPFKTIAKAVSVTDNINKYNIHIDEGIYKGEGNTNLTLPGDYTINIIGSGVNKTIIDGEAAFTVQTSGFYWGSSPEWFYYVNGTGNWFMKVTEGSGLITIKDFTIQHSWSNGTGGGSGIGLYPEATVDNWGTLKAENIYFFNNYAGVGAGIRNNPTGKLYVENCTFDNNTKSVSTGNFGAAIYNNGTAYVNNSQIINNYARWGSVTNDKTLYISNSTFRNNKGYDGTSGQKNGPGIYVNTGSADFFAAYESQGLYTNVDSCVFESNEQCDINIGKANISVTNNIFNNSCGIYITSGTGGLNISQNYTNNQFINMADSTMLVTMLSTTKPSYAINSLGNYNITIENNTIDVPNTEYGYGLYVTGNTLVKNNTLNNVIKVAGQNDTITGNTVTTESEYAITLTTAAKNATITNNTLYAKAVDGDYAVSAIADTVIGNNTPEVFTYVVNDENFTVYFDNDGVLRNDVVVNGSKLVFVENFTNKNLIFDNVKVAVDVNTTLYNTTIITENNAKVLFNNLKIDNTDVDSEYVILLDSAKNTIRNANIHVVSNKAIQVIKVEEDSNTITASTINATMPASDVKYNSDYSIGNVPSAGIFIRSSDNRVNNTKVYVNAPTKEENSDYPTVDGIDIQSKKVGEYVTGNEIRNTRINVTGGSYVYGLNIARAENTITPLSYYDVTSNYYAAAVQIGDSNNNNISGYAYVKSDDTGYAFYSTAMATGITNNTNISAFYIQNMEAPRATGILLEGASNINIVSATHTINGEDVKDIDIKVDWNKNKPENIFINKITAKLNSKNDTSSIITTLASSNVTVNGSIFNSAVGNGINLTNTTDANISNNYINIGNVTGGDDAVTSNIEAEVFNNTPAIGLLTDDTYSSYFDENTIFIGEVDILTLGDDLHNKTLTFYNLTKTLNITNAADYTMKDTTIVLSGDSKTYVGSTPALNVENINFENNNKAVFIDELNGTYQKNVKFTNDNIIATGDDVVVFDAFNNESYIYLDIASNITAEGNNVVVVSYSGYNRGQPAYIHNSNITVKADKDAKVFNTAYATTQFNNNNVNVEAESAVIANYYNSTISYYNFRGNNINITADDAMAINMTKGDTYYAYIDQNTINIKTEKATTAINITGSRTVGVQDNEIVINTENGETPVISVNVPSSSVRNNYIVTKDVTGDAAVEDTSITISGNTPTDTGFKVKINPEEVTWTAIKENNLTITVVNDFDEEITGELKVTVDDEEVTVENNTITYTPEKSGEVTVKITYTDSTGKYETTTESVKIPVETITTVIEITVPSENTVNKSLPITVIIKDELDNIIVKQKVNLTLNSTTEEIDLNGAVVLQYTPTVVGEENVTVSFEGNDVYSPAEQTATIVVTEDKDKIIEDLLAPKNTTLTIDEITDAKYDDTIQISGLLVNDEGSGIVGTVRLVINNGRKTVKTDSAGRFVYNYTLTKVGVYNLSATFEGNDKYVAAEAETTFEVEKQITNIVLDDIASAKFGESVTISGQLVDSNDKGVYGTVKLTINGARATVKTDADGIFTYEFKNAKAGVNNITAAYIESNKYTGVETTSTFEVGALDTQIVLDEIKSVKSGSEVNISGKLVDENGNAVVGTIKLLINNGRATVKTDSEGAFTYTYTLTKVGENNITASYLGSSKYAESNATATVEVTQLDAVLSIDKIENVKKDNQVTITGKLADENGKAIVGTIKLTVNGGRATVKTDATGVFSYTYTASKTGTNNVTASYLGSNTYSATDAASTFEVEKLATKITFNKIGSVAQKTNVSITGTLSDENGKPFIGTIKLLINNGRATVKTVADGSFTYVYNATKAGENTVSATYAESTNYAEATATTTFTVAKA